MSKQTSINHTNTLSRTKNLLRDMHAALLDLIYPPKCLICDELQPLYICKDCQSDIKVIKPPVCARCGMPVEDTYCRECHGVHFSFDSAQAVGEYDGVLKEAIHLLKYSGHEVIAPILGELMVDHLRKQSRLINRVGCLVPMPIHESRLRHRGFNQSELIVKAMAQRLELPVLTNVLQRTKATKPQVEMHLERRRENVEEAFAVTRPDAVDGRIVLLIDDVLTTGSTAHSAAIALRSAGAREIHVLTAARTI